MLPRFPDFRPLQQADYEAIRKLVWGHQPYSDFNANCLLAWDTGGKARVSRLNNNLIVKFYDYPEDRYFYSFIGDSDPNRTAEVLIDFSMSEGLDPALHLVPHNVAARLDRGTFAVEEDPDETDYVLSIEKLCAYQGGEFSGKRYDLRKFLRQSDDISFRTIDFGDERAFQQCRAMFQDWRKSRANLLYGETDREFEAFKRCLQLRSRTDLLGAGVFVNEELKAFAVCQIVQHGYAFNHFEKMDTAQYPGIGAFLTQQLAGELAKRRVKFINIEQDLGIPGLRKNKYSYAPCEFLKKYTVKFVGIESAAQSHAPLQTAQYSVGQPAFL